MNKLLFFLDMSRNPFSGSYSSLILLVIVILALTALVFIFLKRKRDKK